jgi:hypothetical protein
MVQLRESSARMSKARAASLTDYVLKVGAENGVRFLSDARETDGPEVKLPRRRPHG